MTSPLEDGGLSGVFGTVKEEPQNGLQPQSARVAARGEIWLPLPEHLFQLPGRREDSRRTQEDTASMTMHRQETGQLPRLFELTLCRF